MERTHLRKEEEQTNVSPIHGKVKKTAWTKYWIITKSKGRQLR